MASLATTTYFSHKTLIGKKMEEFLWLTATMEKFHSFHFNLPWCSTFFHCMEENYTKLFCIILHRVAFQRNTTFIIKKVLKYAKLRQFCALYANSLYVFLILTRPKLSAFRQDISLYFVKFSLKCFLNFS